jgi:hypothetical protein
MSEKFTLPNGKTLHRWTTGDQEWACTEYDHGTFCRRCVPVTPTMALCLENVVDGLFEIVEQVPGEDFRMRLTDEGNRRVDHLAGDSSGG